MPSVNFEKNKKEALKNLVWDKRRSVVQGSFIVNGKPMDDDTSLAVEYINLYEAFTYDIGESFPVLKYDRFRTLFLDLREALDTHIEGGQYDSEALKRVMVHLNLELGTDVNFTSTFQTMLLEDALQQDYSDLQENFTFDHLYQQYSHGKKESSYPNRQAVGEETTPDYPEDQEPPKKGRGR